MGENILCPDGCFFIVRKGLLYNSRSLKMCCKLSTNRFKILSMEFLECVCHVSMDQPTFRGANLQIAYFAQFVVGKIERVGNLFPNDPFLPEFSESLNNGLFIVGSHL